MPLLPHQQRVVEERAELAGRLERLRSFIGSNAFTGVESAEQVRLCRQLGVMAELALILDQRIAAFGA